MKRALITGVTGQDGPYLARILLGKGYEVYGLTRREASGEVEEEVKILYGDLRDRPSLDRIIREVRPDEVYNLAGQSHVGRSFEAPEETAEVNALGALCLLESIRDAGLASRFYQASSSHLFGRSGNSPMNETTPFHPRSPYAVSKAFAYWSVVNYREAYGMYAVNAIMFNHESPRRSESFVTRKITRSAARIKLGLEERLVLGNLDAKRDWGYAGDYMEAAYLIMQQAEPADFVIATGESHSVREFLEEAFSRLGLRWQEHVDSAAELLRPAEADAEVGDSTRARQLLGWKPKVGFKELVHIMVDHDLELARKELASPQGGSKTR
jgi:GDPmannose 4,6-dehydratase